MHKIPHFLTPPSFTCHVATLLVRLQCTCCPIKLQLLLLCLQLLLQIFLKILEAITCFICTSSNISQCRGCDWWAIFDCQTGFEPQPPLHGRLPWINFGDPPCCNQHRDSGKSNQNTRKEKLAGNTKVQSGTTDVPCQGHAVCHTRESSTLHCDQDRTPAKSNRLVVVNYPSKEANSLQRGVSVQVSFWLME